MKILRIFLILFAFEINAAPKISVIVPVYNVEQFLRECLDSILNQTFTDFEVICIDDASPDGCLQILQEYAAKDRRVRVFHHEKNARVSVARNTGLNAATGEYIAFCDPDDYMHPDMFKIMYKEIRRNGSDVVCCSSSRFNENDKPIIHPSNLYALEFLNDWSLFEHCKKRGFLSVWNCLYKKSLMKSVRFDPELSYDEDTYFNFCVSHFAKRYTKLNIGLYYYRIRTSSVTNSKSFVSKRIGAISKFIEKVYNSSYESIPLSFEQKQRIAFNLAVCEAYSFPISDTYEKLFCVCKFMEDLYSKGFLNLECADGFFNKTIIALLVGIGKIQKLVGTS
jgi:glycosyltransferase involved in cell wall biosynthesis